MQLRAYAAPVFWSAAEIKSRREQAGLTQQQLADALGASRRAVITWERGEASPQGRFFGQLDRVLGGSRPGQREDDDGPLLRDASFAETVNHLVDLYNQSIMSGIRPVMEVDNAPFPADFIADHRIADGPDEPERDQTTHYSEAPGRNGPAPEG